MACRINAACQGLDTRSQVRYFTPEICRCHRFASIPLSARTLGPIRLISSICQNCTIATTEEVIICGCCAFAIDWGKFGRASATGGGHWRGILTLCPGLCHQQGICLSLRERERERAYAGINCECR